MKERLALGREKKERFILDHSFGLFGLGCQITQATAAHAKGPSDVMLILGWSIRDHRAADPQLARHICALESHRSAEGVAARMVVQNLLDGCLAPTNFLVANRPQDQVDEKSDCLEVLLVAVVQHHGLTRLFLTLQATPFRRSRKLHKIPFVGEASPFIRLAPDFRLLPNRSRDFANASSTKLRLPMTAPSVK